MNEIRKLAVTMFVILIILAACAAISGCGSDAEIPEALAAPAEELDTRLVSANNRFGFNMFLAMANDRPGENIMISPASIMTALAMAYNGAEGGTKAAMADAMQLEDMTLEDLNLAFADLLTILRNPDPDLELAVANSIWVREGVAFYDDFLERNRSYYQAAVEELDFASDAAADRINGWVKDQTRGAIDSIVSPPISPDTVMFLINTIYFKGAWTDPFDADRTVDMPFHLPGGGIKEHPIMISRDNFRYYENKMLQMVELPYGVNERIGMYVLLPAEGYGLEGLYRELGEESWEEWTQSLFTEDGTVGLPRFTFEFESSLNEYLIALGMEPAFNANVSDFSGMRPEPPNLVISEVKHKTFIEVNEEGTEAAAVTAIEMEATSAMPTEPFSMICDRPFFFVIADKTTKTILFMGAVLEPY